jgi:hypothetical protein
MREFGQWRYSVDRAATEAAYAREPAEKQLHRSPRSPHLVVFMPVTRRSDLIHGFGLLDRHWYPFLLFLRRKRIAAGQLSPKTRLAQDLAIPTPGLASRKLKQRPSWRSISTKIAVPREASESLLERWPM